MVGNIASGKSTLTALAAAAVPNSRAILENFDDNPFLPLAIRDGARWGFANAVRYYYDYARLYAAGAADGVSAHYFIDAGGATNREVYGRYLIGEHVITADEYAFYLTLCDILRRAYDYPDPDGYIVLHAAPQTCLSRMQSRGWEYQTPVTLAYLTTIQRHLDAFTRALQAAGKPLLVLESGELDFTTPEGRAETARRVRGFVEGGGEVGGR